MDEKQYKQVLSKLDNITKLLALTYVNGIEKQKDKILLLSSLGFTPSEIAQWLDTTNNVVSVTLTKAKKKNKGSS